MIEEHECKLGIVRVMKVTDPERPEFTWHTVLIGRNGRPVEVIGTKIPPNFCAWCGMSLKLN